MIPALMPTYARADIAFVVGEGLTLLDRQGGRYLDFAAGIAVNALGHCHPHLVKTVQDQAQALWHVSNLYRIPEIERLAERLAQASFADTVFFCNSGSEAVEASIKTARAYHSARGAPERWRLVTCAGGFHGRSLTGIAASGSDKMQAGFGPPVPGFDVVAFNDLEAVEAAIGDETAAVLVEPIQGESGVKPADLAYLRGLREICDRHGILLILDEIQTGIGRTGKLFAHEWAGIAPDICAVAKGLGGGFPIGACLATFDAAAGMTPGSHGSTFGGNPLAASVGNAVLDVVLAPGFLAGVDAVARGFWHGLVSLTQRYPEVFPFVRGAGLMLGLKAEPPLGEVLPVLRTHGLVAAPAGENIVRLLPPLICTEADADQALALLDRAAAELSASREAS